MKALASQSTLHVSPAKKPKAAASPVPVSPSFIQPVFTIDHRVIQRKSACACGGGCPSCREDSNHLIQTKLAINTPGDQYEQEADRVADQVLAAPTHPAVLTTPPRIQRYTGQANGQTDEAPASVGQVLASPGRPLETALRHDMEQRFGHDFSRVRVHSGDAADQSAREVSAQAYTVGHNIVFGARRFASETQEGRRLLAHELTHVVQQSSADGNSVGRSNERHGLSPITAEPSLADVLGPKAYTRGATRGQARLVQHSVARRIQLAPMSRTQIYQHKVEIQQKLKRPDLPTDERQRLETELAGVEKALTGAEHNPSDLQGAGFILTQAATLLQVDNMNGQWTPWDLPPVPAAYGEMLFDFYTARSGLAWVAGKRVQVSGKERRARLEAGLRTAQPLIARVEASGGEYSRAWMKNTFWRHYRYAEEETYFDEARELVDQSVADRTAAKGAQTVPKVVGEVEEIRGAAITGRETLTRLLQLYTRFEGGKMEAELAKVMAELDKGTNLPDALKRVNSMKFTQAAFYLRGVLNTIGAVLAIDDLADREKAARRHPNIFASVTDLLNISTRLLEGSMVLTAGLAATVARVAGLAEDAALILQLGSRSLRVIGTIGAAFQTLYGFSVLFDPDATAEQRRGALFNIGLGGAGIGSLPTLWGGTRLWASGPWTVAVLWTALIYQYTRALAAGMKQGWLSFAIRYAFESLQIRAERVSDSAKPLSLALFHLKHLPPASGTHPEASLHAGMESVVRIETDNVRDQLERLIKLTTERSDWFLEREPGDFTAFQRRFIPLKAQFAQAKTSEDVLALALTSLEVIRTAFQESDQIFQAEVKSSM